MKTIKRIVSVVLATLMLFSSMSILSSAVLDDGTQSSFALTTKFYREDPDTGDWIETTRAAKGEEIRARIFMETDYNAGTHTLFWLYPSNFMTFVGSAGYTYKSSVYTSNVRKGYEFENYVDADSIPSTYYWEVNVLQALTPGGLSANDYAQRTINEGYMTEEDYENKGWISVVNDTMDYAPILTDEYYIYEMAFTVNDDATGVGTLKTPEAAILTPERTEAIVNIDRHADPEDMAHMDTMRMFQASWDLSGEDWEVSTESNLFLNVNGTTTTITGDIGTAISTKETVADPTGDTEFLYWDDASTAEVEQYTSAELSALTFDYEDATYNAVFEAAEATYGVKLVEQNTDGTWPTDDEIAAITPVSKAGKLGAVIKAEDYTPVPDGFTIFNPTETVTVDETDTDILTVKLARNEVTVTFEGGNSVTGLYGSTQTAPSKTTDAGYSNEGWYTTDEEGNAVKVADDGGTFEMPAAATDYKSNVVADKQDVTVNITYYDAVLGQTVSVPVVMEDATSTANTVEIVEALPATPAENTDYILISDIAAEANIEHFTYDSTSASNNLTGTASASGLTLTVGYKAVTYTALFDTTNSVPDVKVTAAYGSVISDATLPTKETMENVNTGYTFEGWYIDVNDEATKYVAGVTQITGDVTYTAKYTANEVKVIYEYAGDEPPAGDEYALPETITNAVIGDPIVLPEITAPEGYTFNWTVSNSAYYDGESYSVYTSDVTVTGTWTRLEYTITYYYTDNKTDLDVVATKTYKYGDPVEEVTASLAGKYFTDWTFTKADDSTAIVAEPATMPAYNIHAVANFQDIVYTVRFNKQENVVSGDYYIMDTDTATYSNYIDTVPDTTEEGYRFTGWVYEDGSTVQFPALIEFQDADGAYISVPEGTANWTLLGNAATANVYATYVAKTIDVEFDPDGGYFMIDGEKSYENQIVPTSFGEEIIKPEDPVNDGYTFVMWDPEWVDGQKVEEEEVYYIAVWLPNVTFEFAGNAPEGVTVPEAITAVEYDELITVPELTADGYNYTVTIDSEDAFDNEDGTFNMGSTPVTVTYTWAADTDVQYKVNTYLADVGKATYTAKETLTRFGATGDTIVLSDADKNLYTGFEFSHLDPANATIAGNGTTEVNAYYTRKMVSVTVLDGTGAVISETEVQFGDTLDKPTEDPASPNKGEEFDKWVFEDGTAVDWTAAIDSEDDIVIKPAYKKINYSVTYTQKGDAPAGYELPNADYADTATANYGDEIAIPTWNDDTVPGYNVSIAVQGAENADGVYTVGEENVIVTAVWSYDKFTVNYVTVGEAPSGYALPANKTNVTIGAEVEIPAWVATGAPAGYVLEMSIEGAQQQLDGTYTVYNSDVTVTATWTYVKYTVDYVTVGIAPEGYALPDDISDAIIGTEIEVPAWDNDTVPGYDVTVNVEHAVYSEGVYSVGTQNVTVTATWTYEEYTVDYVTVGEAPAGYELPDDINNAIIGTIFTVPAWDNDTVDGYDVTIEVINAVETDGVYSVGTQNVTVTATWTYEPYTVTYSYDSTAPAAAVVPAAKDVKIGDAVDLTAPAAVSGYEFVAWTVTGAVDNGDGTYTVGAGDVTVVGSWKALDGITYNVQRWFEVLGQEGQYAAEGSLITLTGVAGDKATYDVAVKGFTLDHINPDDATIAGDNSTLINVYYNRKDVSVTYLNEDGEVASETTVQFGGTIANPGDVTSADSGMKFAYWAYEDGTQVDAWPIEVTEESAIVLKPVFDENTYTVRFLFTTEAGEELVYSYNDEAEYKSAIAKPSGTPVKTGYTFVEWRKNSVNGDAWASTDTVPVGGIDYYAYFTANTNISYQVIMKFQGIGTTEIDDSLTQYDFIENQTAGEYITLDLDALVVDGFTIDTANSTYQGIVKGDGTTIFEVIYTRNNVTVTIDGNKVERPVGYVISTAELEEIIKNTKDEGYNYVGWVDASGATVTFPYTVPAAGAVITSVVEAKDIVLTFLDNDDNVVEIQNVKYNEAIVAPEYPVRDGYKATGWYNVDDSTALPATVPAADATYKVAYTNATNTGYKVYIYMMDLEGNYTNITVLNGYGTTGDEARISVESVVGLYEDTTHPDRKLVDTIAADGSTVLKIFYAREKYTVTYDNGTPIEVYYGAAIPTVEDPEITGKKFTGWTPAVPAAMPAENLEFTSTWEDVLYKVTYVVNGVQTVVEYKYGEEIVAPADPTEPGMEFTGWIPEIPETMPAEDIIIVAQFGTSFYTVTFLDDVDGDVFAEYTVMYGQSIIIPEGVPTKEYHTFVQWSNVPETMPADDIVIVPEFSRNPVKLIPMEGSTTVIDRDNNIIYGLKTTLSESILRNQFLDVEGDGYFTITVANGMAGFYGTGAKVELYDNADTTGTPIETYTIIVFGDINGDARINATDCSMISSEISVTNMDELWSYSVLDTYDEYKVLAADINGDGRIDSTDSSTISNVTLGSARIDQVTKEVIRADA